MASTRTVSFPTRPACLAGALALMVAASCASIQAPVTTRAYSYSPVLPADLGSMRNVSVSDEVWMGSFPSVADVDLAHRRGIASIIDLATPQEKAVYDIAAVCASVGIRYINAGIEDDACVSDELVDRVLEELRKLEQRPLLLVCGNGSR